MIINEMLGKKRDVESTIPSFFLLLVRCQKNERFLPEAAYRINPGLHYSQLLAWVRALGVPPGLLRAVKIQPKGLQRPATTFLH